MAGNKSQTTTQSNEPWPAAQPTLKRGLSDANSLYSMGVGSQPNMSSTVVPFSKQSGYGMRGMEAVANASVPALQSNFDQVADTNRRLAGNGGLTDLQQEAVGWLRPMAQGKNLAGNPFVEDIINMNARTMGDAINLQASGMGRTGSVANQDALARNIGDMASTARFNNYNTERGYQQDAIGSIFNAGQQGLQNQLGGTNALTGAYAARMLPEQTMLDLGGMYEDLYGRVINDQSRIFQEQQNAPWDALARLNAIASGAGQMGGTSAATAQGPSRLSGGIGGALAGAGLGMGPLGILGGGLLGLLG